MSASWNTELALILWQQEFHALIKHAPASIISSTTYYSLSCSKYLSVVPEIYRSVKGFSESHAKPKFGYQEDTKC